jgi:5-methylcytosine-specific restriction endonuclease McrA
METRFLFDPPRKPKPKGPTLKSLLVRCPTTSKLTDTGKTIEEERWATIKLKTQKLTCAHCGSVHAWSKDDVILGRPMSR